MRIDHNNFSSLVFWLIVVSIAALCLITANSCVGTFSTVFNRDSRNTKSTIHGTSSQSADSSNFVPSLNLHAK